MSLIDLKQYENVTFPDPDILQKNVEEMLVAFRCLKELYIKGSATEEDIMLLNHLSSIFDGLIIERAKESLKMAMYLEEILDYFQMLIKEDNSAEDLLMTLATLNDMVKNRIVDSEKLENQFKEFKTDIKKRNADATFDVHSGDKKVFLLQELIVKDGSQSENFQSALKSFLIEVAKTSSSILFDLAKISFVIFGLNKCLQLFNVNLTTHRYSFNSSIILEQFSLYKNNNSNGKSNGINNDGNNNNSIVSNKLSRSYNLLANLFLNNLPISLACRLALGYYCSNYKPKELFSKFQRLYNIIKRNRLTIFNSKNNTILMSSKRKHAKKIKECNETISNKLPIIITNLTISTQFWKHQSIIIDSYIDSLRSLDDKNKTFRLPENSTNGFNKIWKEILTHLKESHLILNNFVSQNSLINLDSK